MDKIGYDCVAACVNDMAALQSASLAGTGSLLGAQWLVFHCDLLFHFLYFFQLVLAVSKSDFYRMFNAGLPFRIRVCHTAWQSAREGRISMYRWSAMCRQTVTVMQKMIFRLFRMSECLLPSIITWHPVAYGVNPFRYAVSIWSSAFFRLPTYNVLTGSRMLQTRMDVSAVKAACVSVRMERLLSKIRKRVLTISARCPQLPASGLPHPHMPHPAQPGQRKQTFRHPE